MVKCTDTGSVCRTTRWGNMRTQPNFALCAVMQHQILTARFSSQHCTKIRFGANTKPTTQKLFTHENTGSCRVQSSKGHELLSVTGVSFEIMWHLSKVVHNSRVIKLSIRLNGKEGFDLITVMLAFRLHWDFEGLQSAKCLCGILMDITVFRTNKSRKKRKKTPNKSLEIYLLHCQIPFLLSNLVLRHRLHFVSHFGRSVHSWDFLNAVYPWLHFLKCSHGDKV